MLETEVWTPSVNARNEGRSAGNFLKAKQGYTVRKHGKRQMDVVSSSMKFRNEKKFRYGIPPYTVPFQVLPSTE
jgi:hypothetical protein